MFKNEYDVFNYLCELKKSKGDEDLKDLVIWYLCKTSDFEMCKDLLNNDIIDAYFNKMKDDENFNIEIIPYKFRKAEMYEQLKDKENQSKETSIVIDLLFNKLFIRDIRKKYNKSIEKINSIIYNFKGTDVYSQINDNLEKLTIDFFKNIDKDIELLSSTINSLDLSHDELSSDNKFLFAAENSKLTNSLSSIYEYTKIYDLNQYNYIAKFCEDYLDFDFEHYDYDVKWLKEFDINDNDIENVTEYKLKEIADYLKKFNIPTSNIIVEYAANYYNDDFDLFMDTMISNYSKTLEEEDFFENIENDIKLLTSTINSLDLSFNELSFDDKFSFAAEIGKLNNSIPFIYKYIEVNGLKQYNFINKFCDNYLDFDCDKYEYGVKWLKEFDLKDNDIECVTEYKLKEIVNALKEFNLPTSNIVVEYAADSYYNDELDLFMDYMIRDYLNYSKTLKREDK